MVHAGAVDGVAGGEVVRAVEDDVGDTDARVEGGAAQSFLDGDDFDCRIDRRQRLATRFRLGHANPCLGVEDLSLQVGQIDGVVIDQRDPADAGRGEIERSRRAEAAGTDDQRVAVEDALLAFDAECVKEDVPAVAEQLLVGHLYSRHSGGVSSWSPCGRCSQALT